MGQNMWNKFGSKYSAVESKTASFTAAAPTDNVTSPDAYSCTAATVPIVCTLPSPVAFGTLRIINSSTSKNVVTLSGTLVGSSTVYPGQVAVLVANEASWYNESQQQGGSSVLSVSLSAANLIAMYTTPVSLIPAPGAGKIIIVNSVEMTIVRTSTAFTNGGAVEFRYTDGSGAKVSADMSSTLITGGAGTAYASVQGVTTELTPVANAAIVITNASGVFAAGTGVATVSLDYRITA